MSIGIEDAVQQGRMLLVDLQTKVDRYEDRKDDSTFCSACFQNLLAQIEMIYAEIRNMISLSPAIEKKAKIISLEIKSWEELEAIKNNLEDVVNYLVEIEMIEELDSIPLMYGSPSFFGAEDYI